VIDETSVNVLRNLNLRLDGRDVVLEIMMAGELVRREA
jgi:hypothetical protein